MRRVGQVVELRSKLELEALGDRKYPEYRHIVILQSRGSHNVAARVTEGADRILHERVRIQELILQAMGSSGVNVRRNNVRTIESNADE